MYLWVIVALSCAGYLENASSLTPFDVAILLLSLPGLLGLFGYAYARPFLRQRIWGVWLWLQPLIDAASWIAASFGLGAFAQPVGESWSAYIGIGVALSLPQYVALFRYGYRSQALWERAESWSAR